MFLQLYRNTFRMQVQQCRIDNNLFVSLFLHKILKLNSVDTNSWNLQKLKEKKVKDVIQKYQTKDRT